MNRRSFPLVLSLMLLSAGVIQAQTSEWQPAEAPLMTRWADDVSPDAVKDRPYPRPTMQRDRWQTLNGLWEYAITPVQESVPDEHDGGILVPFAVESALSGVQRRVGPDSLLWYRRTFEVPSSWEGGRIQLHFGAVDWEASVYLNGTQIASHRGGYDAFTADVTEALVEDGPQELVVRVWDPSDEGDQPRGKQVRDPGGIWYTPVTGIWQTVWLEPVPDARLTDFQLRPDIQEEELHIQTEGTPVADGAQVRAVATEGGEEVGRAEGTLGEDLSVEIPDAQLWTPDDPFLYDLRLELVQNGEVTDAVDSYFAMREVTVAPDEEGTPRLMLNGEPVFHVGPLDQGYWPDGLYTAPTDDALRYDIEATKQLGFNATRKHVVVEPSRWYYWADREGLLVWQDMPSADNTSAQGRRQYERELYAMVDQFENHPSIVAWVVFNEGWGQFDAPRLAEAVEEQDPSRLVVDASGWQHKEAGHVIDGHRYQGPLAMSPKDGRASIVGEFGGMGRFIEEHSWTGEGWGYEDTFDSADALTEQYEARMGRAWRNKEKAGMSGAIYTQITDLEEEVNGLLTYDRELIKGDSSRLVAANKGYTPFISPEDGRFMDEVTVEITNGADTELRYTLDGSTPTADSRQYTESFTLDEPTTVKARAFVEGEPVSPVQSVEFENVEGHPPADVSTEDLQSGLAYSYIEGGAMHRPRFKQHWPLRRQLAQGDVFEPTKTGTIRHFDLAPQERDELFAFTFDGYLDVPRDGVYTLYVSVDDDVNVFVGDQKVSDRAGQSPSTTTREIRVPLQAGAHPITVRYFQAYGPSELEIQYEGPGIEKQPIPESDLYHDSSDTEQ